MELSDRKLKILSVVINNYIQYAEPVSSKNLCNLLDFSISSATIRNELAELTELGFLEQPHISAGRIPSNLGYRLYINKLMRKSHLSKKSKDYVDSVLKLSVNDPDMLLKNTSHLLASMTNFAVISTTISTQKIYIKNVRLVQIGTYTAMIILTTSYGLIKNRLFRSEIPLTPDILNMFNNVFNDKFTGVLLTEVTPAFIQTVAASLGEITFFISDALNALLEISKLASKPNFHFDGQANLLLNSEFSQQSVIKLINFFTAFNDISDLFLSHDNDKTHVFIGKENPHEELAQSSVIVTKYTVNGENYGSLGIIGPTRMNYANLIANLEYIASLLGNLLSFD